MNPAPRILIEHTRTTLVVILSPAEFVPLSRRDLKHAVCVVFDNLRATTSMITALANGAAAIIPVVQLDLALAPLVAVDARGWRLGSGAGFYDRRLQHLRRGALWRRPKFIGVAYELQRVPHLDPSPWDVRLDALITEQCFYRYTGTSADDPQG